jgi:hypothetical protein
MTKWIARCIVLMGFAGAAVAEPAAAMAPPAATTPAATASAATGPAATGPAATAPAATAGSADAPAAGSAAPPVSEARKACVAAMNADPTFKIDMLKVADEQAQKQRDDDTIAAHTDAVAHVQKNEVHVIYAYAAMWIVAAAFVIFLWRRQQGLQTEIANLRRDLEAAAEDPAKGRA